ncbi:hypothetical protein PDM28_18200 [Stenotrophomonas aracearum]|uniref:Transmembrane protein n=1 Tax=Stenotrophomonas aracearum TaxID=3003272 RepID=A0ABY9YCF9_9GAMM|nr:hypothetical protein [Stenotrophomonas sp. A5588]WNH48564.1 hypothetical protein PDM28_18200 [Stenotrophomonas sp. A5588]
MNLDLLLSLLGMAAVRLPLLIALGISLVWVVDTPRGAIRSVALWALALLALGTLAGLVLNIVPTYLVQQGNYGNVQMLSWWLRGGHFALSLVNALGMVLLVWAMTRALRNRSAPPVP